MACTASCIDGHVLVDSNYIEDSARGPELVVAYLPNQAQVVTCQLEPKLPMETLGEVMECSISGCKAVYKCLQAMVLEHACALANSRGHMST